MTALMKKILIYYKINTECMEILESIGKYKERNMSVFPGQEKRLER